MKISRGLTGRQGAGILALVESGTVEGAARDSGIGRTTLHGWLKDDNFRARLEAARSEAFDDGLKIIKSAASKAAQKMIELLSSRNEAIRLRASLAVIELGLKVRDSDDLEKRISALEAAILTGKSSGAFMKSP